MSYDPVPECYVCLSKRVTARWTLCHRCEESHRRKGSVSDTVWAAERARMFERARCGKVVADSQPSPDPVRPSK